MILGSTFVKKCPNCCQLNKHNSIKSGNTFGAKYWTDGKQFAPMLPQFLEVVTCPNCHLAEWSSKYISVDSYVMYLSPAIFSNIDEKHKAKQAKERDLRSLYFRVPFVQNPSTQELTKFIFLNKLSIDQELKVRTMIWHKENDLRRHSVEFHSLSKTGVENLKSMVAIFDSSICYPTLNKSEILRELGNFEMAKECIMDSNLMTNKRITKLMLQLIESKDSQVREVIFPF